MFSLGHIKRVVIIIAFDTMIDSGLKRSLDDDSDAGALVIKRAKTSNGGGELVVAGKGSKIKQVRLDSIDIYTYQSTTFPIIPINPTNHTPKHHLLDAQRAPKEHQRSQTL